MNGKTKEFLDRHLINSDCVDMQNLCALIMNEMKLGLEGKKSSMPMINSYCSPDFDAKPGKKVAVIDAGGTNFRTCLVSFDENGQPVIEDFKKSRMPGIDREVNAKEFFCTIADEVERLIEKTDRIGFCFSYAAKILPDHDGVPLFFSKEIKADEVVGKELGKELFAELSERGHDMSAKKIIILNDTVTTLLAGLPVSYKTGCESCIGFILGTGTNTAYVNGKTIINEESGNLSFELGDIDRRFIESTLNPETYHFEKMISGAYLGKSAHFILNQAKKEKLFSDSFTLPEELDTKGLGDFLDGLDSPFSKASEEDRTVCEEILKAFVFRAAKLTAASLAATVLVTDFGKKKPILINADGTTFYKTRYLKEKTEEYLNDYLGQFGRSAKFTQIENAPVIGSAIGALSL